MLNANVIGHIGGDAVCKNENGREFTTFRVAHSDRWTSEDGQTHETTQWVDCIMNGKPNVIDYLKKGQMVFVSGPLTARVYSSAKDRCMKAGITISVRQIELLGGKADDIPSRLYSAETGAEVKVQKFFNAPELQRTKKDAEFIPLVSRAGGQFVADRAGWITKVEERQQ